MSTAFCGSLPPLDLAERMAALIESTPMRALCCLTAADLRARSANSEPMRACESRTSHSDRIGMLPVCGPTTVFDAVPTTPSGAPTDSRGVYENTLPPRTPRSASLASSYAARFASATLRRRETSSSCHGVDAPMYCFIAISMSSCCFVGASASRVRVRRCAVVQQVEEVRVVVLVP